MLLLWAGCLQGSTAPSSCGTETSAEVSSSCLEEARVKHKLSFNKVKLKLSVVSPVVPVLLDLRKLSCMGQTQTSEGACEENEQGHLLDRTPTPTSLEVRERKEHGGK